MKLIFSKEKLILFLILILAAFFRFYNVNWDGGHQLHPDERAIVMTVDKLQIPKNFSDFLRPESSWNPKFFAYGSFPMYLLFATGNIAGIFNPLLAHYGSINLIGRILSAFADIVTVFLIFKISRKLFNSSIGYLAAFFYTVSVLPIQLSHFFAVDTLLTCFITATLYLLILFYEKPTSYKSLLIGLFFGLALATKISALVLLVSIGTALIADFILIFIKNPHKPTHWLPNLPAFLKHLLQYAFLIFSTTFIAFIFFEPYAVIDFKNFWVQTLQQSALTKDPFYFPYTLQYVGKIPYAYEFKNVFLWGLGPVLGILTLLGMFYFIYLNFKKGRSPQFTKALIILIFVVSYVAVVGRFAVGFMRYMLPVYPFFALFASLPSYHFYQILNNRIKNIYTLLVISYLLFVIVLIWPLSFMHIYSKNNTRVDATLWINQFIPKGKTVAIEHWDDGLPLTDQSNYNILTLTLYDPDTQQKWETINQQLRHSDYIIIASNRLYTPLLRLTDCQALPPDRCYPKTSAYYKDLFAEKLGFQKVAEFTNYPTVPMLNLPIDDQVADESFTVYDHPKVMIFQKTASRSRI